MGFDTKVRLTGEPPVTHEFSKAACAIAALGDFAAVGIKNAIFKIDIGVAGWFNQQDLIAANACVAIGEATGELVRHCHGLGHGINNHEVIAEAVHFGEANIHLEGVRQ